MIGPARDRLRRATAEAHRRLDAGIAGRDLADPNIYRRFLLGHAAVLPPLEQALEAAGVQRLLPDWQARRRTEALEADRDEMGLFSPPPMATPVPADEAEAMGALYVLEGSRLGGIVLARQVGPTGQPVRYLSHGRGKGFWPSFLLVLEGCLASETDLETASGAALAVFNAFEEALENAFA